MIVTATVSVEPSDRVIVTTALFKPAGSPVVLAVALMDAAPPLSVDPDPPTTSQG